MTVTMNIAQAKAKLSALVEAALKGEDVVLARDGEPVARIVSLKPAPARTSHVLAALGYPDVAGDTFDPEIDVLAAVDRDRI